MLRKTSFWLVITLLVMQALATQKAAAQGPPRGDGPQGDWMIGIDSNGDGKVDRPELQAAVTRTFVEIDRNGDGTLQTAELPKHYGEPGGPPDRGGRPIGPPPGGFRGDNGPRGRPQGREKKLLPPFFFMEAAKDGASISRPEFERVTSDIFTEMDANRDGVLTRDESHPPRRPEGPPLRPNARFIAAELRFGDKLVKNQPFSAETVIEDTRRLFDGSTVTKRSAGAVYRDGSGRTRREQPLELVGGFSVVGTDNKPQMLVFINDFGAQTQYFLDVNNKVARRQPLGGGVPEPATPPDAQTESLGSKAIEGVACEGTRISFEIPVGHLGNDRPIKVVTENWFSPELQMLVFSRHLDPLSGEHVFKLVNIRRSEPAAALFSVPAGYRIVGKGPRE